MQCYGEGIKRYPKLFNQKLGEVTEGEPKKQVGFAEHWGWYLVYDSLSNNDPLKWDEIDKWDVIRFLNTIAFYRDKQKEQEEIMRSNGRG